jgi:hypothetical protein
MKLTARNTHRDIAYFYVGLIISFALSGIFLNHRQSWHPRRYAYEKREITIAAPIQKDSINEEWVKNFSAKQKIDDHVRRFMAENGKLRISFEKNDVMIDMQTGKGQIETYRTTPLLGQMTQLHQDTSKWWIYYSDIFGIAMLTIALTGMFIEKGKLSFKSRGWKLALIGIVFPLLFLFLIS